MIPRTRTRTGAEMPVLGLGTWRMGEDPRRRAVEVAALRLGFDLGMTLVDTAEMYANGRAEEVVGEAIRGRRDGSFGVSKVLPENASLTGTVEAAGRSLKRLGIDRIDLYLLHWAGSHPLQETFEAFRRLVAQGKILYYGVSNFDLQEMEAAAKPEGGSAVTADQVYYSLEHRGIERGLVPWCVKQGIAVMAYSPLGHGRLERKRALLAVASRHGVSPETIAVAWTIRNEGIVTIPKASDPRHVRENARAADIRLSEEDLAELDRAYPAPTRDVPLEML